MLAHLFMSSYTHCDGVLTISLRDVSARLHVVANFRLGRVSVSRTSWIPQPVHGRLVGWTGSRLQIRQRREECGVGFKKNLRMQCRKAGAFHLRNGIKMRIAVKGRNVNPAYGREINRRALTRRKGACPGKYGVARPLPTRACA